MTGTVAGPGYYFTPRLSHDGRRVAVDISDAASARGDIWIFDLMRKVSDRLTTHPANETAPVWSADDGRIIFCRSRDGTRDLHAITLATNLDQEELLLRNDSWNEPTDCSRDGRILLFNWAHEYAHPDIYTLSLVDLDASPWLATPFDEYDSNLSPDQRWLAYASNETGDLEVYVRSFADPGRNWRISSAGGSMPVWRGDVKELFYLSPDGHLMSVAIAAGSTFDPGMPTSLFETRVRHARLRQYDVSPDGQRILLNRMVDEEDTTPITLDQNWLMGIRR